MSQLARLRAAPAAVVQRITGTGTAPGSLTIEDVVAEARRHRPTINAGLIERAHQVAAEAHEGQLRGSGEPYLIHPVAVAHYLAGLQLDLSTDRSPSGANGSSVVRNTVVSRLARAPPTHRSPSSSSRGSDV